MNSDKSLI